MGLLSLVQNESLTPSVPIWGFWVVALIVCGHAIWVGLCMIFRIPWPGLLSTSVCAFIAFVGLVALWNQAPLDQVVSSQPSLTWLSIGDPPELKISVCFHADRLASGLLLWLLPVILLIWIGQRSVHSTQVTGFVAAVSLILVFLLAFAGDAWEFLVVWMLMTPLSTTLLWSNKRAPETRPLMNYFMPMVLTDMGLLVSMMIIGASRSSTRLAATLHRDILTTIFQDNPAALDTAALGIWIAVCGRVLVPFMSPAVELWRGPNLARMAIYHLACGLAPACLLLLKLHHVIWNSTIIESLVLMTLMMGVLSAYIAACSKHPESAFGSAFSWAGSLVIAAIFSGMKASLISALFVFVSWMALLLVTCWQLNSRRPPGWLCWVVLVILASSVCGIFGLVHEFSENSLLAAIVIIVGQGLAMFAWTRSILTFQKLEQPLISPRRSTLLQLTGVVWGLTIGLLLTQRAWWQSADGLHLLTGSLAWGDIVSPFQQAGAYSTAGLAAAVAGSLGVLTGILVVKLSSARAISERLSSNSLVKLGQQGLYLSSVYFGVSLLVRGVAQLARMFDWIVAGLLTGRAPQKLTFCLQAELNRLVQLPVPWMMMSWMFATAIMLVIFLQSN